MFGKRVEPSQTGDDPRAGDEFGISEALEHNEAKKQMIFAGLSMLMVSPSSPAAAFDAVVKRWATVQSVSGKIEKRFQPKPPDPPAVFKFVVAKSGTYRFESKDVSTFFDGETYYYLDSPNSLYYEIKKSDPGMAGFVAKPSLRTPYALYGFLSGVAQKPVSLNFGNWNGKRALVASFKGDHNFGADHLTSYYDVTSSNPLAVVEGDRLASIVYEFRDLRINVPTTQAEFVWNPPSIFRRSQYEVSALLPLRSVAPALTSLDPYGKKVALIETFRAHKVTLVDFWFYHCPSCMASFPKLKAIYESGRAKGLGILAVNWSDNPALVRRFVKDRSFVIPVVMSGSKKTNDIVKAFKVTAFPTTYAIDQKGKILGRWVGIDEPKVLSDLIHTLNQAGITVEDP
jgi:thiol-disulfide isomerase/thioredoxin